MRPSIILDCKRGEPTHRFALIIFALVAFVCFLVPSSIFFPNFSHKITTLFGVFNSWTKTPQNIQELQQENLSLRTELLNLKAVAQENAQLRQLLNLQKGFTIPTQVARVIQGDPSGLFQSARIDQGSTQNIQEGFGVITPEGVVGVVSRVWPGAADVLLVNDPRMRLDGRIVRNQRRVLLKGQEDGMLGIAFFDRGSPVFMGDTIVTSGLVGPFPQGLAVGTVVENQQIQPAVPLYTLSWVLVLGQQQNEE